MKVVREHFTQQAPASPPELLEAPTRFEKFIEQVFHGNPADMLIQGIGSALGAIVSVWIKINPFVGVYIVLVVVDTFLGVRLSRREGRPFKWSRLLYGPGEKIAFTALILLAAEFMERYIPGEFLTQAIGAYMSVVLFLEALGKYDKLTGHNILALVREKLTWLPAKAGTPPKD